MTISGWLNETRDDILDLAYVAGWQYGMQNNPWRPSNGMVELGAVLSDVDTYDEDDLDAIGSAFENGVREGRVHRHTQEIREELAAQDMSINNHPFSGTTRGYQYATLTS